MRITEIFNNDSTILFEYFDANSFDDLEDSLCTQCYGICFYEDKLVIVRGYFGAKDREWGFTGGKREAGETLEETLRREVQEESNMEILSYRPIGYQKVVNTLDGSYKYELRYVCAVKPYGPFVSDPAGGVIAEVKLIDPRDVRKFVDWGKIGDRLVERAVELWALLDTQAHETHR